MITKGLAAAGAKVYISGRRLEVLQNVATTLASDLGAEIIPCAQFLHISISFVFNDC